MTSKIQVGDIVRVTIEGEVGYVGSDGQGFDFKRTGLSPAPNSVRLNRDGVSVEVVKPAKSKAEKQFDALRVGAAFQIYDIYGYKHGGVRIKTSDTAYFNVDHKVQYHLNDEDTSLTSVAADHIEEVAL